MRWFIPWLGVSELEKAILNISVIIEKIWNETYDAIKALQEVSDLAKITLQNRMALDMMLTSQGGVCTVLNTSCCVYVDQSGRISTELEENWKQTKIIHEIQKDDTSYRFEETFKWLTSSFPNLSLWVKRLLNYIIIALIAFVCIYALVSCVTNCCSKVYEKIISGETDIRKPH